MVSHRCVFVGVLAVVLAAHGDPARARQPRQGEVTRKLKFPSCCPMGAAFDGRSLWVADRKVNKIFAIDPASGKVIRQLATPGYRPTGLAWDGRYLWVADRDRNELFRIDPKTQLVDRVNRVPVRSPRGLAWDGECLYLADAKTDTIYCLDQKDGTTIRTFKAPSNAPTGLTFDGKHLWVADRSHDEIYMVDPQRGHVVGILPSPGPHPWGLAWDGKALWNVDYQTRQLYRINVSATASKMYLGSKTLRVEYVIHFLSQGPDPVRQVDFYFALPRSRYHQTITKRPGLSLTPSARLKDQYGQEVAHLRRSDVKAGVYLEPRMTVEAKLHQTRFWIRPDRVGPLSTIPGEVRQMYLANGRKYRLDNPLVQRASREARGDETNPYWIARNIYQYVLDRLDYKRSGGWDPVPVLLERGTGSCSEYSFVFIALCRAAGIPARYVGGIVTRGDDAFVDNVFHRWAEIYLPGYGWIPVDPDRGDKKTPRGQALGFGNLDNTLFVTTVSGGESRYLDWKYNGSVTWSFKGHSRVYVEHIGEMAPP